MIDREIVFIVYVSDIEASVSFYTSILNLEVSFTSPRYVTMDLAPGVSLALCLLRKTRAGQKVPVRCFAEQKLLYPSPWRGRRVWAHIGNFGGAARYDHLLGGIL